MDYTTHWRRNERTDNRIVERFDAGFNEYIQSEFLLTDGSMPSNQSGELELTHGHHR